MNNGKYNLSPDIFQSVFYCNQRYKKSSTVSTNKNQHFIKASNNIVEATQ